MRAKEHMPFGWWVKQFVEKASDVTEFCMDPREELFYDPMHGFICVTFSNDMKQMYVTKGCGDFIWWLRGQGGALFYEAHGRYGTELIMHTQRRPEAMARLINGEIFDMRAGRNGKPKYFIRSADPLRICEEV